MEFRRKRLIALCPVSATCREIRHVIGIDA